MRSRSACVGRVFELLQTLAPLAVELLRGATSHCARSASATRIPSVDKALAYPILCGRELNRNPRAAVHRAGVWRHGTVRASLMAAIYPHVRGGGVHRPGKADCLVPVSLVPVTARHSSAKRRGAGE